MPNTPEVKKKGPPGDFPRWVYQGVVLDPADLRYAPHPDIIHPSVISTEGRVPGAAARHLMYYAPHDAPGGICLALADAPEGPWREYPENPVIRADWPPYHQVSHVSSPHAVWNRREQRLFLYYHGENDTTRFATSEDGIQIAYGGIAVDTSMLEPGVTEASYARVFHSALRTPHSALPEGYVMFLMGNHQGTRKIYFAESQDGRHWQTRPEAMISPPPGYGQLGPGSLMMWQGVPHLICFGNLEGGPEFEPVSDLLLYRFTSDLTEPTYLGVLLSHKAAGPDNLRINDPCLLEDKDRLYLYLNIGRRLNQRIGLAVSAKS